MKKFKTSRREFILKTTFAAASMAFVRDFTFGSPEPAKNKLPRWKGFNLLDFFSANPPRNPQMNKTTEDDLKWMRDWGFDFVRIPMAYPRYLKFDSSKNISADEIYNYNPAVLDEIDKLIYLAHKYNLHVSLNLHRAPGYCINAGFHEPFNLWKDMEAQEAFSAHWGMWAERYKNISSDKLSFDLLNEPAYIEDMNDQFASKTALAGDVYKKVAEKAVNSIRKASPDRLIIADGNNGGNDVTPELFDLGIAQSCRGYYPHYVSHYQASWVWKDPSKAPVPVWPGIIDGKEFSRKNLENFYKPWIEACSKGIGVHCGECGCYNRTPHNVFLAWFEDVLSILTAAGIGYALWNFKGDFGILDSKRSDIKYTDWYGHELDSKLLNLLQRY
ncbi:MAG TPA: cellulase family glycosylhydrolase [Bacteroidales bacterium]|nr:cellulase family glycosylhydrolase [Bacteroidales bacterium]HOU95310.1 cellulase family glycosylhydrolase [Bacteroidales bacterium]HQG35646.1 cellulase family glycosylhydrolase [Bacteroidales bacterium]HQG51956.1 cellulase family glycosylhydrolase [Bacteroidales bacterium]HQJ19652.1 cellulase family glycosylhydrolase [Bacteroidales bacterium]